MPLPPQRIPPCPPQTASAQGTLTFTFQPPTTGEVWTGTLQVPAAPGGALWTAQLGGTQGGTPVASGIGSNAFGPVQAQSGEVLTVVGTSLQPGTQYVCNWIGEITTDDSAGLIGPDATPSVVQPPNAIFLATTNVLSTAILQRTIAIDSSWRAIWVVTRNGFGGAPTPAILTGQQSLLNYNSVTPPYFTGTATFQRFPLLAGLDTDVTLTIDNLTGLTDTAWWGADLADVDVAIYSTTGGIPGGVTFSGDLSGTDAGPQTVLGIKTIVQDFETVTVTSNAGTCSPDHRGSNFTNSSAAAMTVTVGVTGPVPYDGQPKIVRIYDFSAAAESITWVNTENSENVSVPGTSRGSTTSPLCVGFQWNATTSKWECVAVA